jgi:hypothetical protein
MEGEDPFFHALVPFPLSPFDGPGSGNRYLPAVETPVGLGRIGIAHGMEKSDDASGYR